MPTSYTNRVVTILVLVWISLSAIFPQVPGSLLWFFHMDEPVSLRHNLRPGIDMVGGTSLTYEIKQPEGAAPSPKLAEEVATLLKQRVDPRGVRNLIWRPQGATRLEIQMPTASTGGEAEAKRDAYEAARQKLEATNLRVVSVVEQIRTTPADELKDDIEQWAEGSGNRKDILQKMVDLHARIEQARAQRDKLNPSEQKQRYDELQMEIAEARNQFDKLQTELADSNLPVGQLESILDTVGERRATRLKELHDQFAEFPARIEAIDQFVKARDEFWPVRDTIDDVARLKRDLRGSGVLSFNILIDPGTAEYQRMAERLQEKGPRPEPGDTSQWFEVVKPREVRGGTVRYNDKTYALASIEPNASLMSSEGRAPWKLRRAYPEMQEGQPVVGFEFDSSGAQLFGQLTARYKDHRLGIVLDNKLYSAPNINDRIFGRGVISGDFSFSEQDYLVKTLNAGALPAQLTDDPISEITVGPQLGADNLAAGFQSCVWGMVIVAVFLIGYYYISGVVAYIAVVINLVLILGSMALINATFTLPGVAGIVLSVAMAVDANVLIFERLREEQARGLSLKMALRNAYDRAFSAIIDGQITTAITSAFLFVFGSEEVRGFGLTLLIGIATSLFTALFVTRTIFGIMVEYLGWKDLGSLPKTFPRWNAVLTPTVDWIKLSKYFAVFSAVFIIGGMVCLGVKLKSGDALDIEFSGGTSVRVALTEKMTREQVQDRVDAESEQRGRAFAAPRVVSIGTDDMQYEITTPTTDTRTVQAAVIAAIGDALEVPKPSDFSLADAEFTTALNRAVHPIETAQTRVEGVPQYLLNRHVGGAAIVLSNLNPPLTEKQIVDRLNNRFYQEGEATRPERTEAEVFDGGKRAVVLVSDGRYLYNPADAAALDRWQANLAGPSWQVVQEAINNPPQLKTITKFDAQVADEAVWNTVIALTLSVFGISMYIWMRFGNLKFGGATVVACIHDALFVVAAVGYSHYVAQVEFFENVLLINIFRIDLTLVAAVLTVVGYSMNDTVVVFDRVRENRGKFGVLSRKVVNDSINQTFSRTLLTGGTSLGILLVMYIIGGEGIHAFTFSMLLGIIVGTYSSIVIASPLLLVGGTAEESVAITKPTGPQPAAS